MKGDLTIQTDLYVDGKVCTGFLEVNDTIWVAGEGNPEGEIEAIIGSLYTNKVANPAAGDSVLYVKTAGTGKEGWEVAGTGSSGGGSADLDECITHVEIAQGIGTGERTIFPLGVEPFNINNTLVYISGAYQMKDSYTIEDDNIVFGEAPPLDLPIEVVIYCKGKKVIK